jgi:arylsulfatase A-like enzyme
MKNRGERPNVLVFFTDQQRWDTTGVHGNPLGLTPNFDRMALHGTHLYNAFTPQPVCAPARSCFQTGQYATTTGVWRNLLALKEDAVTLATCFGKAGYDTGYIGKWHLGGVEPGIFDWKEQQPVPKSRRGGYEYWLGADLPEFTSDEYHTVLFDNDNNPVRLHGYRVDAYTDAAIRFITKEGRNRPFFLFLSFLEPHHQNHRDAFAAPDGYADPYVGAWMPPDLQALGGTAAAHLPGYYGMVRKLDEAFGRILDVLKSMDILDNTIVMFTSDHGNHFRTRNAEYKRSCHESSIRIPAAIQGPGFDGGGRVSALTSIIDFAPTLLDAAGLTVPSTMQGRSLMPIIRRQTNQWPEDVLIQISEDTVGRALRTKRWKYGVTATHLDGTKYSTSDRYEETFLYDLQSDPYELVNLINFSSHDAVRASLRKRLLKRIVESGENAPTISPAESSSEGIDQRLVFDNEILE